MVNVGMLLVDLDFLHQTVACWFRDSRIVAPALTLTHSNHCAQRQSVSRAKTLRLVTSFVANLSNAHGSTVLFGRRSCETYDCGFQQLARGTVHSLTQTRALELFGRDSL